MSSSSHKARSRPAPPAGPPPKSKPLSENFIRVWAPTLVAALFIITFNVQAFEIPSSSMEKTLLIGDHLLVDRVRFSPPSRYLHGLEPYRPLEHGDIVVFMSPVQAGLHLVKRVIGLPGDRLKLVDNVVYRNGKALRKPYVQNQPVDCNAPAFDLARDNWPNGGPLEETTPQWTRLQPQFTQGGEVVVPPGHYFMMGDNRLCSWDSRYWGFVPQANLIGRPEIVYWSYKSQETDYLSTNAVDRLTGWVSVLFHFPMRTRWSRTFHITR